MLFRSPDPAVLFEAFFNPPVETRPLSILLEAPSLTSGTTAAEHPRRAHPRPTRHALKQYTHHRALYRCCFRCGLVRYTGAATPSSTALGSCLPSASSPPQLTSFTAVAVHCTGPASPTFSSTALKTSSTAPDVLHIRRHLPQTHRNSFTAAYFQRSCINLGDLDVTGSDTECS